MDTVGANTGHVAHNFNGKHADFTNSLISVNGFLQSLQALDHQISKVDVHYLIKELNLSSNISNDLICYDIFLDSLVDAAINSVSSRDNGAKDAGPTIIAKNELNEELQAIVKAQQEQLRVQNAKVSTLSATTRRLELQNKKLQNELKEKDEEMPISSCMRQPMK